MARAWFAKRAAQKWIEEQAGTFMAPTFVSLFNAYHQEDALFNAALRQHDDDKIAQYHKGRRDAIRDIMDSKL